MMTCKECGLVEGWCGCEAEAQEKAVSELSNFVSRHAYAYWVADKIPAHGDYAKEAAQVLRRQADELIRFKDLYIAINEMMAILGADGEVNTKQMTVINVMDALAEIDGGEFDTEKLFGT